MELVGVGWAELGVTVGVGGVVWIGVGEGVFWVAEGLDAGVVVGGDVGVSPAVG